MSLSAGLPKLSYSNRVFGCSIPFSQQLKRYEPSQILSPLSTNHVRATSSQHGVASRGKQLKEDFKARHKEGQRQKLKAASTEHTATLSKWDLTIGLEIHAQLNTQRKLFSDASTSSEEDPNFNVTFFDLAFPGTQPLFQKSTVLPALRAALALNCEVQDESRFDRKHYFYPDQPAGYQITQYYRPYALNGHMLLHESDGIDPLVAPVRVGIKQVQLEQDTAKSVSQAPSTTLIDFNRVGHPLVEIITLPELHSPQAAAACARKIMSVLQAVNAVSTGMEMGGLRADVNVSVSPKDSSQLGRRVEIKNVSSFKGIEQAIVAERDRQVEILEDGGVIESETRGWTLGDTETIRLRGKEGEVDYRYMPDPDVPPLLLDQDLTTHVRQTLPPLPDDLANDLVVEGGITLKDAKTLVTLDDGERLDYFDEVCAAWIALQPDAAAADISKLASNWIIHELGGLLSNSATPFSRDLVPAKAMASLLRHLHEKVVTGNSAKFILSEIFNGSDQDVESIIDETSLRIQNLTTAQYNSLAQDMIDQNPKQVQAIQRGQLGKVKFLVGQMIRTSDGTLEPLKAEEALRGLLQLERDSR